MDKKQYLVQMNIRPSLVLGVDDHNLQHGCHDGQTEKTKMEEKKGLRRNLKKHLEECMEMSEEEGVAEIKAKLEANKAKIQAMPQFHHYTHVKVSSMWDQEGRKVDCGMVMCDHCLDFEAISYAGNREFKCPKCDEKTILDVWEASVQINIDKEEERKENLEKLLTSKMEGKTKIKAVLEFLRDTPPFPSDFFDMAMEEGMPMKEESEEEEEATTDQECSLM